ncbi:MAG: PASTA domain-containing protein [Bacteroidota bacterium]|nr:PASTA domain-containing protein [Bacteroidota bacterium]
MKIIRFLTSKTFAANLVLALIVLIILFFLLDYSMNRYTRHGQRIVVPDLTRVSLEDAGLALEDLDLSFEVLDSAEFSPDFPPGSVVAQYPEAGMEVKEGRVIRLTLNPFQPRKIEMPDLEEKTLRRAIYDLESKGFNIGNFIYKPYLARDVVIGMEVDGKDAKPGDPFDKGTTVDLVLGEGLSAEKVPVPYLKYKDLNEATAAIKRSSLNLGVVIYDEDVKDTSAAVVYKQSPLPNWSPVIRLGGSIDLWMTEDRTKIVNDSLQFLLRQPGIDSAEVMVPDHQMQDPT